MARQAKDGGIEPTIIILLNSHSVKLTHNNLSLYLQISALLSSYHRSSICSRWRLTQRHTNGKRGGNKRPQNAQP